MFGKIVAISTVKPVSQNYAFATGSARVVKSVYFWSDAKYPKRIPLTFIKMDTPCRTRETFKDLRAASKVVCDVNSEYRRIQVNSAFS